MTVKGIGRGLRSAAQNIEKEIPKIGPAIGETVRKITAGKSEKWELSAAAKLIGTSDPPGEWRRRRPYGALEPATESPEATLSRTA